MTTLATEMLRANADALGRSLRGAVRADAAEAARDYLDVLPLASGFLGLAWSRLNEALDRGMPGLELSAALTQVRDLAVEFSGLCMAIRSAALDAPDFAGKADRLKGAEAAGKQAEDVRHEADALLSWLGRPLPLIDESCLPSPSGGPGEAIGYENLDDILARLRSGQDP